MICSMEITDNCGTSHLLYGIKQKQVSYHNKKIYIREERLKNEYQNNLSISDRIRPP